MGDGYQGRAAIRSFWDSGSDSTALARAVGETMAVTMAAVSCCIALDPRQRSKPDRVHRAGRNRRHTPGPATEAGFAVGATLFVLTYTVNILAVGATRRRLGVKRKGVAGRVSNLIKRGIASINGIWPTQGRLNVQADPFLPSRYDIYRRRKEKFSRLVISSSLFVGLAFLLILLQTILETGLAGIDFDFLTDFLSEAGECGYWTHHLGFTLVDHPHDALRTSGRNRCAVYLTELAPVGLLNQFLRRTLQNLAAVPSIISDSWDSTFSAGCSASGSVCSQVP